MQSQSGYPFPIFISSTHYNLVDLRAELYRHLQELGYNPFLSSAEGFPDKTPEFEPWESCLPVLNNCFVIVLVIDGKYGEELQWPHFKDFFKDRQISPTHAEYIFAHKKNKRLLVFVRKSLVAYYQSYRKVSNETSSPEEADELMNKILPKGVDVRSLKFFQEIKTTKPIPWIVEFEDVTEIKPEIQRKMLNELAERFMQKDLKFIQLGEMFNEVADEIPPEKTKDILQKINTKKARMFERKHAEEKAKQKEDKTIGPDSATEESTVKESIHETEGIGTNNNNEASVSPSGLLIDQYGRLRFNPSSALLTTGSDFLFNPLGQQSPAICEKCGKLENLNSPLELGDLGFNDFNTCKVCGRILCRECFPITDYYGPFNCCSDCSLTMALPEEHGN